MTGSAASSERVTCMSKARGRSGFLLIYIFPFGVPIMARVSSEDFKGNRTEVLSKCQNVSWASLQHCKGTLHCTVDSTGLPPKHLLYSEVKAE